jgi:glycosyltransferase involved in cell wall biosynthesis
MNNRLLSVIIPTYNPEINRLSQTITALKKQDLDYSDWELIIIDNNSSASFMDQVDLTWHPAAQIVREPKQGLTFARLKGFREAKGAIIVLLDDDNVPAVNYLSEIRNIFNGNAKLGAIGGKSLPVFEALPPTWLRDFYANLALRDLGNQAIVEKWDHQYPRAAPIGAGMALRKAALETYIRKIQAGGEVITDRNGGSLSSGGDNDINIEILKSGWSTGYFPSLVIRLLIPKERMRPDYLARLLKDTNKSWVELLAYHGINPWNKIAGWTVALRKIKAWFSYKAWKSKTGYLRWKGACGIFEGLSEIDKH